MSKIAEMMREWKERGFAPFPTPAFTPANAERHRRLDHAEMRVLSVCAAVIADPVALLEAAPPFDGTEHRTKILDAAHNMVAAGIDYDRVVRIVASGAFGVDDMRDLAHQHFARRESLIFGKFPPPTENA